MAWRQTAEFTVGRGKCSCEDAVVCRTSWTDQNPGRRYISCPRFREHGGCDFFRWLDSPMCSRSTQIIPGLLRRANKFAAQVEVLEADVERLESDVKRHETNLKALAAAKCKLEEYEKKRRNRERWLCTALLISWFIIWIKNT